MLFTLCDDCSDFEKLLDLVAVHYGEKYWWILKYYIQLYRTLTNFVPYSTYNIPTLPNFKYIYTVMAVSQRSWTNKKITKCKTTKMDLFKQHIKNYIIKLMCVNAQRQSLLLLTLRRMFGE